MDPKSIGKYGIVGRLGQGGMGQVWLGEDPLLGRKVALKVLQPGAEEESRRFLEEARTIGRLVHPNIVVLVEFGFHEERPFLAMEYLPGETLDRWLQGPHSLRDRARVIDGVCRAIEYAHGQGVIHRDIKPSNVQVLPGGDAKLMDFGIARASAVGLTGDGTLLGTPEYMAPEILGSEPASPRSDVFSAGVLFQELLTGRNPFRGESVAASLKKVLFEEPAPIRSLAPEVPEDLAAAVSACLRKRPADRPSELSEVRRACERLLASTGEPPVHAGDSVPTMMLAGGARDLARIDSRRWNRRIWMLAALSAVVLAVGVAVVRLRTAPPPSAPGSVAARPVTPAAEPASVASAPGVTSAVVASAAPTPVSKEGAGPETTRRTAPKGPAVEVRPGGDPRAPKGSTVVLAPAESAAPPPRSAEPDPTSRPLPAASSDLRPAPVPATASPPARVAIPTPVVVSVEPNSLRRGRSATLRLVGRDFPPGATVVFRRGRQATEAIRILEMKRSSSTLLEVQLLVEEDAPLGSFSVSVRGADGRAGAGVDLEVEL